MPDTETMKTTPDAVQCEAAAKKCLSWICALTAQDAQGNLTRMVSKAYVYYVKHVEPVQDVTFSDWMSEAAESYEKDITEGLKVPKRFNLKDAFAEKYLPSAVKTRICELYAVFSGLTTVTQGGLIRTFRLKIENKKLSDLTNEL